jgi:hypothetical protein
MVGFGEIVVFGGAPEDGQDDDSQFLLQRFGQADGGEDLVDGVHGAGEQPRLLPGGHHRPALLHEPRQPLRRAGRGGAHGRGRHLPLAPAEPPLHLRQLLAEGFQVVRVPEKESRGPRQARLVVVGQAVAAQGRDFDPQCQWCLPVRNTRSNRRE